jgi:hypothetical protein
MIGKTPSASVPPIENTKRAAEIAGHSGAGQWEDLIARTGRLLTQTATSAPASATAQIADLLKLQVDVSRYQLRVEMLAKIADSAMTSMRKLQQNQ